MKATNAVNRGITIITIVMLKFQVNRENKNMPLGWVGVNWSSSGLLLLNELYPLMKWREDKAEKQGFTAIRVNKEKKLICMTAIIYTPIILPDMRPATKTKAASPHTAAHKAAITPAV